MAQKGFRVAVIGATGAVGSEIIDVLEQRRLPVLELLPFASEASEATHVEFRGEEVDVGLPEASLLADCDLVFCAAPHVLREFLPALRQSDTRVVDLSGEFETDPGIPMHLPGVTSVHASSPFVAIPRGIVAGAALALAPIAREIELTRVTLVCLETASAAGLAGIGELTNHTIALLNEMTGETLPSEVFPRSLAFDCLPLVGEGGEPDVPSERSLRDVLRRLLGSPDLPVETTRIHIPALGGSVAAVHLALSHDLPAAQARDLWEKAPGLRLLDEADLPTPRGALGHDDVEIGRLRSNPEDARRLAFVLALNNLRRGAALCAIEAAEVLLG
ncbi:MAG: hypothetical protein GY725_11960 [bacterium]|nr:hypothetical protein [bacterium]